MIGRFHEFFQGQPVALARAAAYLSKVKPDRVVCGYRCREEPRQAALWPVLHGEEDRGAEMRWELVRQEVRGQGRSGISVFHYVEVRSSSPGLFICSYL